MLCRRAVSVRLSVRPSVCPPVTFEYSVETSKHFLKLFSLSGGHTILVLFFHTKCCGNIPTETAITGAKIAIFDDIPFILFLSSTVSCPAKAGNAYVILDMIRPVNN